MGVLRWTRRVPRNTRCTGRPAAPWRRFHALRDKAVRGDVLWRAWVAVRVNDGAPGIDQITLNQVEQYGVTGLLDELADELGGAASPVAGPAGVHLEAGSADRAALVLV